jgi:hypothetical protein
MIGATYQAVEHRPMSVVKGTLIVLGVLFLVFVVPFIIFVTAGVLLASRTVAP